MVKPFNAPSFDTTCTMYIGRVAELTGATPKAIRLYESRGLIPVPERKNTYRLYSDLHAFLVHMIKQAQDVGFTLAELDGILGNVANGQAFPIELANALVEEKKAAIADEITLLQDRVARLSALQGEMKTLFGP